MATSEVFRREHSNMKQEEVIQNLIELFGNVLDCEIIRSVALSCNCNMETTSNILLEMSSSIGAVPKKPKHEKRKKQNNTKTAISNAIAATQSHDNDNNADVIIESERVINYLPSTMNSPYVISSPKTSSPPQAQRKSKKEQEFDRIVLHVRQGSRILIFLRGLPGSGKSYLAKEIVDKAVGLSEYQTFILSSDDYFINKRTGIYEYDRTKLQEAHEWNQQRAYRSMAGGISPVIIDNTNSQMWEMKSYAMMATNYGYRIEIVEPFTYWAFNDKELARRNRHGVPKTKIKEMFERYEKNITPTKLLAMYGLSYNAHFKPPVNRNYPPIPHNSINYNKLNDATVNSVRIKRLTNGVSNAIAADYGQDENFQFNSNEPKTFSNIQNSIDLMDFEDVASQSVPHVPNIEEIKSDEQNFNSVDSILMHSPTNTTGVLEPSIWGSYNKHDLNTSINFEPELKKIRTHSVHIIPCSSKESVEEEEAPSEKLESASTSTNTRAVDIGTTKNAMEINKLRNIYPNLDLSSWGLPENAMSSWQSWDFVSPLNCAAELNNYNFEERAKSQSSVPVETLESSTNTSSSDFALLDEEYSALNHFKMLEAKSRDITEGIIVSPPMSPPKKTLLDKSSMTNEDVLCAALSRERTTNDEKQIRELRMLFPNIPLDYLTDVYEKCKKDLNWAVDLLLDDSKEISESLTIGDSTDKFKDSSLERETVIVNEENNDSDNSALLQASMEDLKININEPDVNLNDEKHKSLSQEVIELKKHIEDNVEINKDCYSQHILKIKNLRRGISNDSNSSQQIDQPSTSTSNFDAYFTSKGQVIAVNSDEELDDFEPDIDFPQSEESEEEMVELNLGNTCVSQLEAKFGFPDVFPQGFLPVVQVPAWLAGQLHAFYVESVLGQMETQNQVLDMIIKEDEEFAKKLQMQEEASSVVEDRKTPDLQRIMEDEQLASNLYKKQTEEWQQLTPDNLAAKLTRQKLFTAFPTVEETLLTEILHAHGNSYEQTIEVLLASTERDKIVDPDGTIREPPITEAVINEMKKAEEETKTSTNVPDVPKSATEYREEASAYLKKHKELIQKANQAYQKKQFPVAQFYSDLAKTYTQLYDQANGLAAMAFLDEHSKKLQSYHTLDLHYLYVKEAIEALDMFIDQNIQLLQGANKRCENLFIITGRGKRSDQGKSRLKPAVMARLRKRNIWYCEMNPGLLKVRVRADSKLTSNVH